MLKYKQSRKLTKDYYHQKLGLWIKTFGKPDKLDYDRHTVIELKTYAKPKNKEIQIESAHFQAQFYCWQIGFDHYEIHVYNSRTKMMEEIIEGRFDLKEFSESLDCAIELQDFGLIKGNSPSQFASLSKQYA